MGLPRAIQAHQQGDQVLAAQHYQRALDQQVRDPVLYQNYGAILRTQGEEDRAAQLYAEGLALYPDHLGILLNYANLQLTRQPATALALSLRVIRLLQQRPDRDKLRTAALNALNLLRDLACPQWHLALLRWSLLQLGPEPALLLHLLLVREGFSSAAGSSGQKVLADQIEASLEACTPLEQAEVRFGLAGHLLGRADVFAALEHYERGMALLAAQTPQAAEDQQACQKLVDVNSWNFACTLLKLQDLQRGWKLYEYGLRTPAEGKQRWQRALRKPFSATQLPLWRGEGLRGRRLLLLEEQAIGDAMMFITLVPTLLEEAASIGLLLGERLLPIYRRSFAEWIASGRIHLHGYADLAKGRLSSSDYDLQSPLGSICQYRFVAVSDYGRHLPLLRPKPQRVQELREAYRHQGDGPPAERLIGISWRGGGKGVRIKQKSIDTDNFADLLKGLPGVRFVSLQYGKSAPVVEVWRRQGLDVLHDPRVDPLKQMDLWLAQVAACDAVLSVANTTIHGAGGLHLPTLCLLSLHSDWRWFSDETVSRSYWYPSVGIAREQRNGGWADAFAQARQWLEQGCPMPVGPVHTHPPGGS